jgi:hypothetical protein
MPMTKAQSRSLREHLGNDSFQMILRYSSDARPPWLVFQAADFQVKTHPIASQATGRPRGWFNLRISKSMNWLIFPSSMFLKGTLQLLRKEIVTNPHIVLILIQVTLLYIIYFNPHTHQRIENETTSKCKNLLLQSRPLGGNRFEVCDISIKKL